MKSLLYILLAILIITACEKPATEEEWGYSLLYIPQAVLQSGGANNNFYVELNASSSPDTSIVVGLYRSGMAPVEAVSVELSVDADSLNQAISGGLISNAVLLDPMYYQLPATLSLKAGNRSNYDYIVIHKDLLWNDTEPDDMRFILPVRISNPTLYELNEDLSLCMFVFTRNK
ncbi:BT_3987 domain-containing protein [Bacteroidota bacterium]